MPFLGDFIDDLKKYGSCSVEFGCVGPDASISANFETKGLLEFFELVESRME